MAGPRRNGSGQWNGGGRRSEAAGLGREGSLEAERQCSVVRGIGGREDMQ